MRCARASRPVLLQQQQLSHQQHQQQQSLRRAALPSVSSCLTVGRQLVLGVGQPQRQHHIILLHGGSRGMLVRRVVLQGGSRAAAPSKEYQEPASFALASTGPSHRLCMVELEAAVHGMAHKVGAAAGHLQPDATVAFLRCRGGGQWCDCGPGHGPTPKPIISMHTPPISPRARPVGRHPARW